MGYLPIHPSQAGWPRRSFAFFPAIPPPLGSLQTVEPVIFKSHFKRAALCDGSGPSTLKKPLLLGQSMGEAIHDVV